MHENHEFYFYMDINTNFEVHDVTSYTRKHHNVSVILLMAITYTNNVLCDVITKDVNLFTPSLASFSPCLRRYRRTRKDYEGYRIAPNFRSIKIFVLSKQLRNYLLRIFVS